MYTTFRGLRIVDLYVHEPIKQLTYKRRNGSMRAQKSFIDGHSDHSLGQACFDELFARCDFSWKVGPTRVLGILLIP
jgi:hypothetical protein